MTTTTGGAERGAHRWAKPVQSHEEARVQSGRI